uniref:Uncharacterized protein n=1 Tax=Rhizophora mucronata TaxID=61149 RepID=A0A2P2P6C1_RHIMU
MVLRGPRFCSFPVAAIISSYYLLQCFRICVQ